MNTEPYKKPDLEVFRQVVFDLGGNLTLVSRRFGVSRTTIWNWMKADPEFNQVVKDERGRLYDDCVATARLVAMGIRAFEDVTDDNGNPVFDKDGKRAKKFAGWIERPDANMLRYFMGSLGAREGFHGVDEETVKNGVPIKAWIKLMNDGDAEPDL
jgi:hypothetical protein